MNRFSILIILLVWVSSIGCSVKYPVVGSFSNHNEVFKGQVDSNLLTGTSYIEVNGQVTKVKCSGNSNVTYIPPISYVLPVCQGQRGVAMLRCDDGRIVEGRWTAQSCTSNMGSRRVKQIGGTHLTQVPPTRCVFFGRSAGTAMGQSSQPVP